MDSLTAPIGKRGHGRSRSGDERRLVAALSPSAKGPLEEDQEDPLGDKSVVRAASPPSRQVPVESRMKPSDAPNTGTGRDDVPPKDLSFLLVPENFRPIPLHTIPQAFFDSLHAVKRDDSLQQLIQRGQFHAAAIKSAQHLTSLSNSSDPLLIFNLIYTRLACLTLINKTCQELAGVESTILGDLSSTFYRHPITNVHIVPWDLRVLAVRLQSIGFKDWRRGIMGFYQLAQDARQELMSSRNSVQSIARSDTIGEIVWATRLHDLGIRVASMLVEMDDLEGAGNHLRSLQAVVLPENQETKRIVFMEALVWLQVGDISAAKRCLTRWEVSSKLSTTPDLSTRILHSLVYMSEGDFTAAASELQQMRSEYPSDTMISHNLAVCLLYTGRIKEARHLLETAVESSDSAPFPSLLFNLCTIYELCSERAVEMKSRLVNRIAATTPASSGWEIAATHFKVELIRT